MLKNMTVNGLPVSDFKWYECALVMRDFSVIECTEGLRHIATDDDDAIAKMWHKLLNTDYSESDLKRMVRKILVRPVPDEILKKYDLNDTEDYKRFRQYKNDDMASVSN